MIEFELFIKYFSGGANPEEAEQVETFAQSSSDGYAYVLSLFKSWLETEGEHYEKPDVQKEWEQFSSKYLQQPKKRRFRMISIAATLAILLGIAGYFVFFNNNPSTEKISVLAQQKQVIYLNDSSKITLASGSSVEYPKSFNKNNRELKLRGDAHFEVYQNSKWPFIIHLQNNLNVRVTGTVFSIKETEEKITVNLKKGSVLFYNQTDKLPLIAGQTGQFVINENKFTLALPELKTGSFQFKDIPLGEVATQLEQYFQVHIQFKNPGIAHCRFSAGMEHQNLEQIIQIIAVTFNLDYHIEKDNVYLDGEACH